MLPSAEIIHYELRVIWHTCCKHNTIYAGAMLGKSRRSCVPYKLHHAINLISRGNVVFGRFSNTPPYVFDISGQHIYTRCKAIMLNPYSAGIDFSRKNL